jgi:serine protease Do
METIMKMIFEKFRNRLPAMALASAVVLAGSALAFTQKSGQQSKCCPAAVNVLVDETSVPRVGLPSGSYAPIVKRVAPAVVKIETTTTVKDLSTQQFPGLNDPFWRRFFGDQSGQMFPPRQHGHRRL